MAKKWLKLKYSRKPHICGIRGLSVKPGTDKHKRYEKLYSHLTYELRNITGFKVTVKTDIYSMGYIFQKIYRQVKSNPLEILSVSMMSNNAVKDRIFPM